VVELLFPGSFDVTPMGLGGFDVVVFYKEFAPLELTATAQPAQAGERDRQRFAGSFLRHRTPERRIGAVAVVFGR